MDCVYCEANLPDRGFFCPSCSKQVKCKACSEILEQSAKACIFCGEEVIVKRVDSRMNSIEFSESRGTRNFKATFSDTVGKNIVESFGVFVSPKIGVKSPKDLSSTMEDDVQDVEFQEEASPKALTQNPDLVQLKKIFKVDGESISLFESRLKAKSKRDYGVRLCCLFLYLKKLMGVERVPRIELTHILKEASVEDANLRHWIVKETSLIRQANEEIQILLPGIEFAKETMAEVHDSSITCKWKLGTKAKSPKRAKVGAVN